MLVMAHFSVNTLVATYAEHLGATPVFMGLLTGMFFFVALAMRPVSGPMITKIDKRKLLIIVFMLGCVINIGYAFFNSIPFFIAFRVLNGIQYSFMGSLVMTLAGDSLPKAKMASGMGIYGIGQAIGMAIGPAVGYEVFQWGTRVKNTDTGFTFLFLFAALIFALALIPSFVIKPDRKTKEEIASTGAWYKNILSKHAAPMAIVMFFVMIGYSILNSYIFNLGSEKNIANVNLFYTFMAGMLLLSRPIAGWLADKYGGATIIIPGLVIFSAAFLVLGFATSLPLILLGAVIAALGVGGAQPTIQAMSLQSESPLKRSVASNTLFIGMDMGLFMGPLIGGKVVDISSFATTFKLVPIPILIGLVCFIIILPIQKRRVAQLDALGE